MEYSIKENMVSPGKGEVSKSGDSIYIVYVALQSFVLFKSSSACLISYWMIQNDGCCVQILIDNKQYYKFLGRSINMVSLIKLYIEEGKVVRHEDWYVLIY